MISSRSVNLYVVRRMALMVVLILGTVGWAGVAYLQGRPNWVVLVGCILPVYLIWAWSAGWRDHLTITPRGIEGLRHDRPVAWTELASVQATGTEVVFTPRDPELVPLRESRIPRGRWSRTPTFVRSVDRSALPLVLEAAAAAGVVVQADSSSMR